MFRMPCGNKTMKRSGIILPYATHIAYEACASASRTCASSSSFSGMKTGILCDSARTLTGDGVITRPRPAGRSGFVTTKDGTKPAVRSACSVSAATCGVPKKIKDFIPCTIAHAYVLHSRAILPICSSRALSFAGTCHMNRLAHLRLTTIWYAVSALIAPEVVASFEETYHVEVSIHEFESEFDLVRAYREQPDLDAYDLIFFSDTVAEELRRLGVLSSIKKNQVPNIEYIAPTLLDTRVNAEGLHAVPYMFGTTGIVYNEKYVDADTVDWSSFWDEQYRGKSCLLNDESEVIAAAALSQGFDAVPTNDAAMREVTALVRQYTENDGTYCGD